ncbi:MAG: (2Fe-2S)-binding protein [Candidatus Dormibacteraeota bacterium]|nr:(2Fe-2S)-binding protein [Candidatus Dormibacteraeota bacterium]
MSERHTIRLTVNGKEVERAVEPRLTLLDFLRQDLELHGAHAGCEHGVCGTCTVLLDGETIRSCLMFAVQADGRSVTTIEGIAAPGTLHPVQQAFWDHQALQCGYCTPAMVLRAIELLRENPHPSREEVREGIASQLCRCTGYQYIVDAVLAASGQPAAATTSEA